MNLSQLIAAALGLAADATEEQGVTAINSLKSDNEIALNRATTPDLNKFIPIETHHVALNRAVTAETQLQEIANQEIEGLVQSVIDDGKVAPANKEMFVDMCRTEGGVEKFKAFAASAPLVATNAQKKAPKGQGGNAQLEEHEIAMCRKMGMPQDEFLKAKEAMNVGAK